MERSNHHSSYGTPSSYSSSPPPEMGKQQDRNPFRKHITLITLSFLFFQLLFVILVEIGSVSVRGDIRDWFFLRIDVSNIVPASVQNALLINTIARSIGLHDFYQVGLWTFCEGYKTDGVTFCSKPESMFWFNPVAVIKGELLAGATINLPNDINNTLALIKTASQIMFVFFMASIVSAVLMFIAVPINARTGRYTGVIAFLSGFNAIFVTGASVIATVMFVIFRNVVTSNADVNIKAKIGNRLFGFMWTASICAVVACIIQIGRCCCGSSRKQKRGREMKHNRMGKVGHWLAKS